MFFIFGALRGPAVLDVADRRPQQFDRRLVGGDSGRGSRRTARLGGSATRSRWWCRGDPAQGRGGRPGRRCSSPRPSPAPAAVWGYLRPGSDWRKAPGARRAASSSGAVQARAPGGGDPLAVPVGDEPHGWRGSGEPRRWGPWSRARTAPGGLGQAAQPVAFPRALRFQAGAPPLRSARPGRAPVGQFGAHAAPFKEAPSSSPGVQIPKPRARAPSMPRTHGDAGSGVPGTRWSARILTRIASR